MKPSLFLKLAPERRQVLSFLMQKSLEILQMPQLDLGEWLIKEIEKNPLLELDSYKKSPRIEKEIPAKISLYEHLLTQLREAFLDRKEKRIAQMLFEQIDEKGFLPAKLKVKGPTLRILEMMQTFDPPGIFARDLKECFSIQLRLKGKKNTLTYKLVDECFNDLLHGRFTLIKKKLGTTDLGSAIHDLTRLNLRPANVFNENPAAHIHIDLRITKIQGGWTLELVEEDLPVFHIQDEYLDLSPESSEEKASLREFKTQAKWIFRSLKRRRKLLKQLGGILVIKQAAFLEAKGPLKSLTMKEVASKLDVHESTLSRALSGKYASTPRGILPLRSLLTKTPETISAKGMLEKLISNEDKCKPLTDDQLARLLNEKGFLIARRTIAKYRGQLKIGPANQRKHLKRKIP